MKDEFHIWIDPGNASAQTLAEVLISLSEMYRALGGPGFTFIITDETLELPNGHVATKLIAVAIE